MKRTEFETRLVALEADFANKKIEIENIINNIYEEMDVHDKAIIECKGRVRNLRNNIDQIKAQYLEDRAKLYVECNIEQNEEEC